VATPGRITSSRERARERSRERRSRRGRRALRWGIALLVLAVSFFAGLAVGRAVEDQPADGDQTLVRTLLPTTLTPRETVTVTVSKP
jgi:anti-sigma factor RsiW